MAGFIHSVTLFQLHLQQTPGRSDLSPGPELNGDFLSAFNFGACSRVLNLKPLSLLQRIKIGVQDCRLKGAKQKERKKIDDG
jgi:hypothetical protein